MTGTPANEAIALLIDLAQRGEIDPWDVQVIEVIDRYLSTLTLGNDAEPGRRDADLSQSGQAFLWASMLVLLKADTLMRLGEPEEPELTELQEDLDASNESRLPLHLERHLRRRRAAPPPKRRPVTLSELIEQLQQMATQLGEAPVRQRTLRPRPQSRTQAEAAIAHLAHDENLTELAMHLEGFLSSHWQEVSAGKDWLNLEQLLEWWTLSSATSGTADSLRDSLASHEVVMETTEPKASDRVGVFWALLLLSAQSKVELFQEEFYQDLQIRALR
ncbi:segregation/condensation protein A [Allocoleopsis sp.]|uniref:segregation/condensation protein A n=1 Tax=Allocoleopsis sp. TaxID=3088169 RepID=UPI002FD755B0